jgi:hypothetical protein
VVQASVASCFARKREFRPTAEALAAKWQALAGQQTASYNAAAADTRSSVDSNPFASNTMTS